MIDNSAPIFSAISEGAVISAGGIDKDYQNMSDTLFLSWTASDSGTGVANYQYAVGVGAGGSQIIPWTSVGSATADTVVFPSYQPMIEGATYFLSVIATDIAGNVSATVVSDTIYRLASAPVITTIDSTIIWEDSLYTYSVQLTDLDLTTVLGLSLIHI